MTGAVTVALVVLVVLALILLTALPSYLRTRRGTDDSGESWERGESKAERQQRARDFDAVDHGDFTGRRGDQGGQY
jgi:Tfp pilus assembly protein PilX